MNELEFKRYVMAVMEGMHFNVQAHEDKWETAIPDLSFSVSGFDGWIELKWIDREVYGTFDQAGLGKHQAAWLADRGTAGSGLCFVMIGTKAGVYLYRWQAALNWINGSQHFGTKYDSVSLALAAIIDQARNP